MCGDSESKVNSNEKDEVYLSNDAGDLSNTTYQHFKHFSGKNCAARICDALDDVMHSEAEDGKSSYKGTFLVHPVDRKELEGWKDEVQQALDKADFEGIEVTAVKGLGKKPSEIHVSCAWKQDMPTLDKEEEDDA